MVSNERITNEPSLYSVHPSIKHLQKIVENLPNKTGRSLHDWVDVVRAAGIANAKEIKAWLKSEHQLGGVTATIIADTLTGNGQDHDEVAYLETAVQYVENLYSGRKESLRPIHDALFKISLGLGKDIKVSPCKTMVPIYRNHVIAEIKPSTQTRVDLGLALKAFKGDLPERLIDTGGLAKGDRITHRIPLSTVGEIDDEVHKWLQVAYELDQ